MAHLFFGGEGFVLLLDLSKNPTRLTKFCWEVLLLVVFQSCEDAQHRWWFQNVVG